MKTPGGLVNGEIQVEMHGFGFSLTRFVGLVETLIVNSVTAIDEESYSLPSPITAAGSIWRRRARRSTVPSRSRLFLERSARTTTARLGAAVLWPRPLRRVRLRSFVA